MAKWVSAAALLLAVCAAHGAHAQTRAELRDTVALEADRIDDDQENNQIIAEGDVQASYQGRILRADRLIYDLNTRKIRAIGNVAIIDADGGQRFADEVEVDENLSDGFAIGFSTRFEDGSTAAANTAVRQSDGIHAVDQAVYTACKVCEDGADGRPTWSVRARRAVLNENTDTISYRDAVFEIAGVPVLYLPYLFHPDPTSERRSGFLPPKPGVSDRLGFTWGQPYYQTLGKSADATITPFYYANARPRVAVETRKRFYSGFTDFDGSYTYERGFDSDGNLDPTTPETSRWNIYGEGRFRISPKWEWGFGAERTSDDTFARFYDVEGRGRSYGLYDSQELVNKSEAFVAGQGRRFYVDASVLTFQSEVSGVTDGTLPVAPLIFAEHFQDLDAWGEGQLTFSSALLNRTDGLDSRRVSVGGAWRNTGILPGGFVVEPFLEARGDYYDLDAGLSEEANASRGVGSIGTKLSWPLQSVSGGFDILIEPTVMAAYGFANANDLPIVVEDDVLYEYDETSLFDANGFGSYDLYEGDGRLAAGFTGSARFGRRRIDFEAGRRWRTRADENFDVASNLDGLSSDWVAAISGDLTRTLRFNTRIRIDPDTYDINRLDAGLSTQTKYWRIRGRYFRVDESVVPSGLATEGVAAGAELYPHPNIALIYNQAFDFVAGENRSKAFGLAYIDDCSRFELTVNQTGFVSGPIQPNTSIQFRFVLKNLGAFGSGDFQ